MKLQITKRMIFKTEINLFEDDKLLCHPNCAQLYKNSCTCQFYELNLYKMKDNNFIRCYECIRSGKEIK